MPKEWFLMKLKRAYIFLLSFLSLSAMFSSCYYLSYKHALNQFNKRAVERKEELIAINDNNNPSSLETNGDPDILPVDMNPSLTIQPTTKYVLETYNMKTGITEIKELNPPGYLVGLTREGVENYINEYMKDMTLSEYNNGLLSYDLINFSGDRVVLRKSYNEDIVAFRFYVVVKNGFVVVFNSDLKSVFSYTHIEAENLPEEDRIALSQGIYVDSLDELYGLLESYSS